MALRDKLTTTSEQLLAGKKALADALIQVGITAVEPNPNVPDKYETFQSYADKVKRLMISNSLILEFTIPEEGFENLTKYKRTCFLELSGNSTTYNEVIVDIVNSDTGYTPSNTRRITNPLSVEQIDNYNTVTDPFGNKVADATIEFDATEIDEDECRLKALEELSKMPSLLAVNNDDYAYSINWGDSDEVYEFKSVEETPEAWCHTYEQPGTYDVTINGIFKKLGCTPRWSGLLIVDGEYFYDKDGEPVYKDYNLWGCKYLKKVIAWGNTQFSSFYMALNGAAALESIPMYDTTNSFEKVISHFYGLRLTSSLKSLPYDSNTERGLFSNCPLTTSFVSCFYSSVNIAGEIPPLLIDNCKECTNISSLFQDCILLTGSIPSRMLKGLPKLTKANQTFYNTGISGEIPDGLFDDTPKLYDIGGMLLGCKVTGVVPSRLFSPLTGRTIETKGTLCRMEAFCYKNSLSGISADAFEDYTVDRTHAWIMFANNDDYQFELPSGLFDFLKDGMEFSAINMFFGTSFSGLPTDILYQISGVTDARGMFSANQFLKSEIQVPTYNTYEDIKPFLGVLAYCVNISNIEDVPAELGGFGSRLFPQYHVGQICLDDGTFVEIKDYVYDENNLPIGFCYYSDDNVNKIASFSQSLLRWTTQLHINELYNAPLSTILDGNYVLYWDAVYLNEDGEETTDIWLNWSGYTEHKDWYETLQACENYKFGTKNRKTYIPAISEVCDMYALCGWFNYARDIVIDRSNGVYTKQNCVGYQLSTSYSSCNNDNVVISLVYMKGGTGKIYQYTCSTSMYFKFCTNIPQA